MTAAKQAPKAVPHQNAPIVPTPQDRARQEGKCGQCGRLASEIGECGSPLTCSKEPAPLAPDDVIVECKTCGTTRVVSTGLALKGKPAIGRGGEGAACKCGESQVARIIG